MGIKDLAERVKKEFPTKIRIRHLGKTLEFYFSPSNNPENHPNFPLGEISPNGRGTLIYDVTSYNSSIKDRISRSLGIKRNPIIDRKVNVVYGKLFGELYKFFRREYSIEEREKGIFILRNKV